MSNWDRGREGWGKDHYYRESLTYEEKFQFQIDNVISAFNADDLRMIATTVDTLDRLITPKMMDKDYIDAMNGNEKKGIIGWYDKFEQEQKEKMQQYEEEIKNAGCPDVVEKPQQMPSKYLYDEKFYIIMNLLERKGLLLKEKITSYLR